MANGEFTSEVQKYYIDATQEEKNKLIQLWSNRCIKWIKQADQLVKQQKSLSANSQKLAKASKENLENMVNALAKIQINSQSLTTSKEVLDDGYELLNEIGESIRGKQLLYSITVIPRGQGITLTDKRTKKIVTFTVPMETLLTITRYTSTRMFLQGRSKIYDVLHNHKEKLASGISEDDWGADKIEAYRQYDKCVRHIQREAYSLVNTGNTLEGFFKYIAGSRYGQSIPNDRDQEYHASVAASFRASLGNTPFWQGGDLGDIQIKGLNASITNLNSLINTITKLTNILLRAPINSKVLAKAQQPAMDKIESYGEEFTEQIVDQLLKELFIKKTKN